MLSLAKPLLILISTAWRKYRQMQKSQLLKNKDFQSKADRFYYIAFNAESKEDISFKMDFMSDSLASGRKLRILKAVDDCARESRA